MILLIPPDRVLFRLTPATNRARRRRKSRPITARGVAALALRGADILAVASDALLRVSEVAALDVQDVDLEEQTVSIRRGRTDQEGEDVVQFLGEPTTERIRAWLAGSGLTQGALFRAVNQGAGCGTAAAINLKRLAAAGARPPCRGATRKGNSQSRAPWRDSATACECGFGQ